MANGPQELYTEYAVKKEAHFVTIDLGAAAEARSMTGIFVPEGYHEPSQVDMILWLMGHHKGGDFPTSLAIDDYWRNYSFFRFREFVNVGHKNVILVAPSLGPSSQAGKLAEAGGLSWYLDQILAALQDSGTLTSAPMMGDLVIACHSGGGAPMRAIATTSQTYSDRIKEVWGFDCFYSDTDPAAWLKWSDDTGGKVRIRYGSGGTDVRSVNLKRLGAGKSNIDVDGNTGTTHNEVPKLYWNKFMRGAHFLLDT